MILKKNPKSTSYTWFMHAPRDKAKELVKRGSKKKEIDWKRVVKVALKRINKLLIMIRKCRRTHIAMHGLAHFKLSSSHLLLCTAFAPLSLFSFSLYTQNLSIN